MFCATSPHGLRHAVAAARRAGVAEIANHPRSRHRLRQKLRAKLRVAARLPELARLGFPLLVGTSRKSFIGRALKAESRDATEQRPNLGHSCHGSSQHPARRAHRSRPRRSRNGPSSPRRRRNPVPALASKMSGALARNRGIDRGGWVGSRCRASKPGQPRPQREK